MLKILWSKTYLSENAVNGEQKLQFIKINLVTYKSRSNNRQTSWNNWNQHNNKMGRDLPRCISEPRLSRDKLSHSTSLDSLATTAMPNILREVLYRKLDTKTNILQSKWVKNWAVLQDNTLYIYADSKETDSVIVRNK